MSIYDFIRKCAIFYFAAHEFNAFPVYFFYYFKFLIFFTMDTGEQHKATEYLVK